MSLRRLLPVFALVAIVTGTVFAARHASPPTPPPVPDSKSTQAQPVAPEAPEPPDDDADLDDGGAPGVGVGEDITVPAGKTHNGDVVCVKGHAKIEGHVNGSVTVVAGTLDLSGSVAGDVVTVLSKARLSETAKIDGSLVNVAGPLDREGGAISGTVTNIPISIPFLGKGPDWGLGWGVFSGLFFWWKLFALFLFFLCAIFMAALVPDRIRLISEETPVRLFSAFLAGLIGYMVFFMLQVFLFFTIIGIPLVCVLWLVFIVLKWLAMCGVFHQIGSRFARSLGRNMSLIGGILLGLLPFALLRFLPLCIGWSIWFLAEILGFGILILTRVGTRRSTGVPTKAPPPTVVVPAEGTATG